jgi:tetratricopeptide (TPR) repeat protein
LLHACEAARFGRQVVAAELAAHFALFERVLQAAERSGRTKRIWPLWAMVLFVPPWTGAALGATPDELFYRGNLTYAAQDYAASIAAYEGAVARGVASANLFFNLGNAYFKAGNLGKAILNYERARWLAPHDADVLANLEFARAQAHSPACTPKRWEQFLLPLASRFSPTALWRTVSGLYAAALLAASLAMVHRTWRRRWRTAAVLATIVFVFAGANLLWREVFHPWSNRAVAINAVAARFAPENDETEHFRLPVGSTVQLRERRGQWVLVQRCDGRRGWVPAATIEPLEPSLPAPNTGAPTS